MNDQITKHFCFTMTHKSVWLLIGKFHPFLHEGSERDAMRQSHRPASLTEAGEVKPKAGDNTAVTLWDRHHKIASDYSLRKMRHGCHQCGTHVSITEMTTEVCG